jgi:8-oxo-dGTP pyrophosphatase MutT (NUDIX family)
MAKKLGGYIQRGALASDNLKLFKACGALLLANDTKRLLFLLRDNDTHSNTWGLVGGKVEDNESVFQALEREILEEVGKPVTIRKTIPIELFNSEDGNFEYHTFVCLIDEEFIPKLSDEHKGYCWCDVESFPKPLHPGLWSSLSNYEVKKKLNTVREILEITC